MLSAPCAAQTVASQPLPEEAIPSVSELPAAYPPSWILVHDLHGASIVDGRLVIADTANKSQPLKGMVRAAQMAGTLYSPSRREIYTAETFYPRLTRGERTDAITIWDASTLRPKGEIILPGGKRQQSVPYSGLFQFTNGDRWVLVANFTPAHSISVVDLEARKVLNEIDLPGCSHIYPTGERGFSSFCADGSMISITLDEKGAAASSKTIEGVQDIDNQPMFQMPAMVGKTAWFVTYHGQLKAFDLSGPIAQPLNVNLSVGSAEGGAPEWRPGGWQVIASDAKGRLYVLMSPAGKEGSHKDGGSEVWVIDPASGERLSRISLPNGATSILLTRESTPHLIAARLDGLIDVLDAGTGKLVHNLGDRVAPTPILLAPGS
ncbi:MULTISPECIES: amine dehydrogenase large subunit [unclassified Phenylobacterium]|uniref:amine dehydrogenase large subunit n=1 Tax=unclassified Phenylobacterium TaxID=2640670 RepID=UPI001F223814|nr:MULTISPECIES: amine dehydrogenase large subunit [unclassified Phenylobacterium]